MAGVMGHGDEIDDRIGWRDRKAVLAAGLVVLALAAGILGLFGAVSEASRSTVLEGLNESVFWLAGAAIGACATIAALMLTTLTLMPHLETRQLTPRFLYHLRLTVVGALATIALAVLDLLLTVFPAAGTERFTPSQAEVNTLYFATLTVTALTVGGFAVVLAALYQTIAEVFSHLPRAWVEDILAEDEGEDAAKDTAPVGGSRGPSLQSPDKEPKGRPARRIWRGQVLPDPGRPAPRGRIWAATWRRDAPGGRRRAGGTAMMGGWEGWERWTRERDNDRRRAATRNARIQGIGDAVGTDRRGRTHQRHGPVSRVAVSRPLSRGWLYASPSSPIFRINTPGRSP